MARPWRAALLMLGAAWLVLTPQARAGGSTLNFERPAYRVGEVAYGVAAVSYAHNPELGTPEEGPYLLHLAPSTSVDQDRPWPYVPEGAVRVGTVEFRRGPVQEPGTDHLAGPDHVVTEFTVPDLPPGTYATIVCNDPCRSSIGDIVYGRFVIEAGDRTPNAAPVTLAAGDGEGSSRRMVLGGSALLLAGGAAALAARRRRSRRSAEPDFV